jgi:hypothetical protein
LRLRAKDKLDELISRRLPLSELSEGLDLMLHAERGSVRRDAEPPRR